jgi:hypothetical protein
MLLHVDHGTVDACRMGVPKFLSTVATTINCPLHSLSSRWISNSTLTDLIGDLKRSVAESNRTTLLISGSYLEDQVSVCSLEALVEGFDVHLLYDMISARDVVLKPVLLMRLLQAGAVPSSLRQFMYIWLASETDKTLSNALRELLEDYDIVFTKRPA